MKFWSVVLGFGILASSVFGYPLREYRRVLGSNAVMETEVQKRVAKVRELLSPFNVAPPNFAALHDPKGPFRTWPAGTDNGRKISPSGVVKTELIKIAEELRAQELWGHPLTFDPSVFSPAEMDTKMKVWRGGFCEEKMGKTGLYPALVNQYASQLRLAALAKPGKSAAETRSAERVEQDRAAQITRYIEKFGPPVRGQSIQELLGRVEKVQFVDEHVTRMSFVRREKGLANGAVVEVTPVNLNMLTTFRTDRDKYYLVTLDCLSEYVTARVGAKRPGPENKDDLELVQFELLGKQVDGKLVQRGKLPEAKSIHQILARLAPKGATEHRALDFLIDLYIQLRGTDIPADEEMVFPEDPKKADPKMTKSLVSYFQRQRSNPTLEEDAGFYKMVHQQLFELQNHLERQRELQKLTGAMVLDVKELFQ